MAMFVADACRLKCIGIQAQRQELQKQETPLYANFSFDCFQMFALFKILLKVQKMCAQTASLLIFPTDAFLLNPVGIDVQQAEVTRKHMFKHIFAIFSAS